MKVYQRIHTLFYFNRLVCKGSKHQGNCPNGGQQCVCIGLVFLAYTDIPSSSDDVDHFLDLGTKLYSEVNVNENYLMTTELPNAVDIEGVLYEVDILEPRSGTLSQTSDHLDSLSFCITSALTYSFRDSNTCFLTIGNSPGYTSGIKRTASDQYYVFDSHSRDDQGRCSPSGKAIVLQINSMVQLVKYVKDMSQSISSTSNEPFEITPVLIKSSTITSRNDNFSASDHENFTFTTEEM